MHFYIKVMRFLHVFDTAGFSAQLSYIDKDNKHDILQLRQLDPTGFSEYYEGTTRLFNDAFVLIAYAKDIQDYYDHIIFNDFPDMISQFSGHPSKTIMYHGSSLRQNPDRKEDLQAQRVMVSDKDLIPIRPKATYVYSPVDRELFSTRKCGTGTVIHLRDYHHPTWLKSEYPDMLIDVNVIFKGKPFCNYKEMPEQLGLYDTYLDVRWDYHKPPNLIMCPSGTALQMLSIGGKVMDNEYNLITSFPEENDLVNVHKRFIKQYED